MNLHYSAILFAGLTGLITAILLGTAGGVIIFVLGITTLIFIYQIVFAGFGVLFGYSYPNEGWKLGIWLSLCYSFLVVLFLINNFFYNNQYDGVFWNHEFFPVAFLLYLSPIITACVSANAGAKRSFKAFSLIAATLILTFAGATYIKSNNSSTDTNTATFNLIENKDIHLQVEINCTRTTSKDYMRFNTSEILDCQNKIFVLKKPVSYSLPTTVSWIIDGAKETGSIYPKINSSDSFGIDMSKSQNYDAVNTWLMEMPLNKIVQSRQVNFRWGKINIDFGESELKSFRGALENLK